jgi:hypothetical protein
MAELRNKHLIDIHNLHRADGELLLLLKSVDKIQNMFKDFEIDIGQGILTDDMVLEGHLMSLTMAISNVIGYMISKNINIDETKVFFEQMLNETMRQIKRENVRTGREQVENLIQQSHIPVMERNYMITAQLKPRPPFVELFVSQRIALRVAQRVAPPVPLFAAQRIAQRFAQPVAAQPVAAQPVAAQPVAAHRFAQPVAAQPVAAQRFAQPVAAQRFAQSVAAQPVAAQIELRKPTPQKDIDELNQKEQAKLGVLYSNRLNCLICKENEVNTVLIPCGHLFCSRCIQENKQIQIAKNVTPTCPECNQTFTSMHNIYYQKYLKYKNKYLQLKTKNF